MKKSSLLLSLSLMALAVPALAQAPAAAPAMNVGPKIEGLCVYSVEAAVSQSEMGVAAGERMKTLQASVEAEVKPEREAIEAQAKVLQAEANNIKDAASRSAFEPKAKAFQTRANAFEEKVNLRVKELQATQQKAQQMIAAELEAPLQASYQSKGCGLLVDRNAVLFANPAMDITEDVVTRLNGIKKTITFDRERLDAAARPAAPKPAATAAKPATPAAKPAAAKPAAKPAN